MSVALPAPWVSVPGEQNVGWSISAQVRVRDMAGCLGILNGWTMYGDLGLFTGTANLSGPFAGSPVVLETVTIPFGTDPPWSGWGTFTEVGTGFRKGRRLENFTGDSPAFGQRDWRQVDSWFSDAGSQIVQTFTYGGSSWTFTQTFSDPPADVGPIIGSLAFELNVTSNRITPPIDVQMRSMSVTEWDAALIQQLDDGVVRGTGSGACEIYALGDRANYCAGHYAITYDDSISKYGQSAPNWARVLDTFYCAGPSGALPYITFPSQNGGFIAHLVSWPISQHVFGQLGPGVSVGNYIQFLVQPAWAASLDPPLSAADQYVGIEGHCGLDSPSNPTAYKPLTLRFPSSVDLHRPDGNKPSSWVTLNAGLGTVADGATNVVFTVTGAGAQFRRSLSSAWRARADYRDVRHHAGEDVFWVASYGWMKQHWATSGAVGASLEARGVHYEIGVGEHPFDILYPFSLASGAQDKYIDLLAGSGAETYPTRVDDWTLTFDTPGTYTLSGMALVARTDLSDGSSGKVHFKTDPTQPSVNLDYTEVVAALDGAITLGVLPPAAGNKGNETVPEDYGGSPRHILTDMLLLIDAFLASGPEYGLGNIEGVNDPTYDVAVYRAANRDTYNVDYGPENADWVSPYVPDQLIDVDTNWLPEVRPLVARLRFTNRSAYKIRSRWHLMGGIETLAMDGGARAAAGASVPIYRADTGALVGTGIADAQGFAVVSPLPANSSLAVRGAL